MKPHKEKIWGALNESLFPLISSNEESRHSHLNLLQSLCRNNKEIEGIFAEKCFQEILFADQISKRRLFCRYALTYLSEGAVYEYGKLKWERYCEVMAQEQPKSIRSPSREVNVIDFETELIQGKHNEFGEVSEWNVSLFKEANKMEWNEETIQREISELPRILSLDQNSFQVIFGAKKNPLFLF